MRIMVTGGAGFIGSNLAVALIENGHEVVVIDDLSSGYKKNLQPVMDSIDFIKGSVIDKKLLEKSMRKVDAIFHTAAVASVQRSIDQPAYCHEINVVGTINVLEAARRNHAKKVVFSSSAAVYGDRPDLPKKETSIPDPRSPYAADKLACEYYMKLYHDLFGIQTLSFRYFNVFGENQDPTSEYAAVIPLFIRSMLEGKAPVILGDGTQTRDFTYILDLVNGMQKALDHDLDGSVVNLATGKKASLLDLISSLNSILRTDISPKFGKRRKGDIHESYSDITRARKMFGYSPEYSFETGLKRTVEFFRDKSNS
jgi:UDP-glucose 4-epimerase